MPTSAKRRRLPLSWALGAVRTRLRARLGGRDGGSSSLELVVLFPAVLLLFFGVVQGALYYHARNVALAAAREGLRAERAVGGSPSAGAGQAQQFLDDAGGGKVLTGTSITPALTVTQASVTVTGRSYSIVPGLPGFSVSQTATGTVERYTTPTG